MSEKLHVGDDLGLQRLAEALHGTAILALDSEFLTERNYYPRLCLLQVGAPGLLATVDPLAVKDLRPLGEVIAAAAELVVHAGAQDLAILQRHVGPVPEAVFDTQIAAAFLGYGHSISHARLVEACCGVQLARSQAYTDWARRPLDDNQLEYALDDVRYLLPIRERLAAALDKRGRRDWADEELAVARRAALAEVEPREQWRRLSGLRATKPRELAILQELAAWREHEAQRRDIPRQRVAPDRVLLQIGRSAPRRAEQLVGMRGLHPREQERSGEAIVATVRRGLDRPEETLPRAPSGGRRGEDPQNAVAAALADTYLKTKARQLDIAPQLLANRKDLESLVRSLSAGEKPAPRGARDDRSGPPPIRLLEGWRRQIAGDDVLRLLAGEVGLRVRVSEDGVELIVEE